METVSVIIPTFNRASTILKSVQSTLKQSYHSLEVIVIDDGSADNTEQIVESIHDARVKYVRLEKNSGASYARNRGIEIASGNYIAFHDSDDLMRPDRIAKQIDFCKKTKSDMVFGLVNRVNVANQKTCIEPDNVDSSFLPDNAYTYFLMEGKVWTQTVLGRAECVKNVLFDCELPNRVDWDWSIRFSEKYRINFQNLICADSYISENSISQNQAKALKSTKKMYKKYYKDIISDKKLNKKWVQEISQFSWNTRQMNSSESFNAFLTTKKFSWLVKSILLKIAGRNIYSFLGK